jgi:hypothetical protein
MVSIKITFMYGIAVQLYTKALTKPSTITQSKKPSLAWTSLPLGLCWWREDTIKMKKCKECKSPLKLVGSVKPGTPFEEVKNGGDTTDLNYLEGVEYFVFFMFISCVAHYAILG